MSPLATKRPKVLVFDDYSRMSKRAALEVSHVIRSRRTPDDGNKSIVLGLATGSSPLGVYRELVKMYRRGEVDFSNCVFFNLDEYYGLSKNDLQSYYRFMKENLFDHVGVSESQINIPDGTLEGEDRIRSYCEDYETKIRGYGGIDLQILGIGRDGHIGFNEPGSSLDSRTRLVELAETTRRDASADFFGLGNVPTKALTIGIATILEAKQIILMASGEHKARVVRRALEGVPTSEVPASFLQYHHAVEVLSDTSAASLLIEYSAPWLVNHNIDWGKERTLSRSAIIWLARRRNKTLFELTDEDYRGNGLGTLLASLGNSVGRELVVGLESKIDLLERLLDRNGLEGKRVVIFSPHPDDDVICMGSTMKKMVDRGVEVCVAYMVSGANAVKDLDVLNYIALGNDKVRGLISEDASLNGRTYAQAVDTIVQSIYSKPKGAMDDHIVRIIKAEIRRQEAVRASSRAGAKAYFLNLPFYEEYGTARKAPISDEDVRIVRKFLLDSLPDAIFLAGDSTDPNGTHSMCMDAFQEAFRTFSDHAETDAQKEYVSRIKKTEKTQGNENYPMILHYRGAWQEFAIEEVDAIEVFDKAAMGEKIKMILEHVSQLDPLFPGPDDDRQFWERARDRNIEFVNSSKKLGLKMNGLGAEVYKISS